MSATWDCGAEFSEDRAYRYRLWRTWNNRLPICLFIGLNPSTADETQDDPTIRRCVRFAQSWGCGKLWMGNLFAFRATKPKDLIAADDPVGPENDAHLMYMAEESVPVVAAWGATVDHLALRGRDSVIDKLIPAMRCLGTTKMGRPRHPLYVRGDTELRAYPEGFTLPVIQD